MAGATDHDEDKKVFEGDEIPSIFPATPSEEGGWHLVFGPKNKLFWYHPTEGRSQWQTPAEVKPVRWRRCYKRGRIVYVNMETMEKLKRLPMARLNTNSQTIPPPPQLMDHVEDDDDNDVPMEAAEENPRDWVSERTSDGKPCWYNVPLNIVRLRKPRRLATAPHGVVGANWMLKNGKKHSFYVHKYTRDVVCRPADNDATIRSGTTKRRNYAEFLIPDSQTALGRKLVDYTQHELNVRMNAPASKRGLLDRFKFYKDFSLKENPDKSWSIVHSDRPDGEPAAVLSPEDFKVYMANPHIHQVFVNGREFIRSQDPIGPSMRKASFDADRRFSPRTPYARRQGEVKTVEHWGERKLLMLQLEFLTNYGHLSDTVVYAGPADAAHLNALSSRFFPNHTFIVVNDAPLHIRETDHIKVFERPLLPASFQEFKDNGFLLIAEITFDKKSRPEIAGSAAVAALDNDMTLQRDICHAMNPQASLLKFRLPYPPPITCVPYFDGDIYLPVWGQRTNTEARIVVTDPSSTKMYDIKDYEGFMFHFNTVTRTTYFEHDVVAPGIDHCFDCASEIVILREWLDKNGPAAPDEETRNAQIGQLSEEVSRLLSNRRKLSITTHELINFSQP